MLNWKTNPRGEPYLYEVNRDEFAVRSARETFSRRFMSELLEDDCLYIVIGSDSGLLIDYVVENRRPAGKSRYIFVEPSEVFEALAEKRGNLAEGIQVCTPDELDACRPAARFVQYCYRGRVRVVKSLAAEQDPSRIYASVSESVAISQTKNEHEVLASLGSKVFVEKHVLNAPDYYRAASDVYPSLAGKRVLIVAAGPSLDDHLEWIRAHRSRFMIIAVSRVGATLKQAGIKPDFYSIIDPHPIMLNVARDALVQSVDVPLLASYHANTDVVANWGREVYFAGTRLPWQSPLNISAPGVFGPTVTHFSLLIAIRAQPAEIYVVGMDLCFGGRGLKSHCSGSGENKAGPALGRIGVQQVKTYAGDTADADVNLLMSVDSAALLAGLAGQMGVPLYNLSRNAAMVEGIAYRNPVDIDFASTPSADEGAESVALPADEREGYRRYLEALKTEFSSLSDDLVALRRDLSKRQRRIQSLFDVRGMMIRKNSALVDGVDRRVGKLGREIDEFLKHWGVGYFMANYDDKEVEEITPKDLTRFYESYYEAFLKSIDEVVALLHRARQKCDRRLRELEGGPCRPLLADWLAAGEYLRIDKAMLAPGLQGADDYASVRSELRERFDAFYADLARADAARCESSVNQRNVVSTAYYLYDRRRPEALTELIDFVRANQGSKFGEELGFLLEGLSEELAGRAHAALDAFERVINGADRSLMELALLQIYGIARDRQDTDLCLQALDCLEPFSKSYLKYHAEMLIHAGDVRAALDKLADYHAEFPEDVDNLVRIVDIYHVTGNQAQAKTLLAQVAAGHPQHAGVRRMARELGVTLP